MERLKHNEVDIAITTSSGLVTEYMEASPAFVISIIPVAKKLHPLAQIKGVIPAKVAAQYSQVIVRDSSRRQEKQSLDVIEGGRQCHVTDFISKKKLLASALGWGGLPEYLIEDELADGTLVPLKVEGFDVRRSELYLIRRRDKAHGLVAQQVWETLHEHFAN